MLLYLFFKGLQHEIDESRYPSVHPLHEELTIDRFYLSAPFYKFILRSIETFLLVFIEVRLKKDFIEFCYTIKNKNKKPAEDKTKLFC